MVLAPGVMYPDVELLVIDWLKVRPALGGARVAAETPSDLASHLPFVQIVRFSGNDDIRTIEDHDLDGDIYAGTRQAARDLAAVVLQELRLYLPSTVAHGAVVTRVATIIGPTWRPYENTRLRRYGFSCRVSTHVSVTSTP